MAHEMGSLAPGDRVRVKDEPEHVGEIVTGRQPIHGMIVPVRFDHKPDAIIPTWSHELERVLDEPEQRS